MNLARRRVPFPATADRLSAIRLREADIGAWVQLDFPAIHAAIDSDAPIFGVKDVIDVSGMPTRAGSLTRAAAPAATTDASIVRRLRKAGWVPAGKTVTTEFAFVDPPRTRNPYALTHSPGGSSSGSAAAVAAGMIPLALGTQTAGSLCRPAAYCGISAIKPSFGLLPTDGLVPLAPSFDTVGVMARDVRRAAQSLAIMAARTMLAESHIPHRMKLACLPARHHENSSSDIRTFHQRTIAALRMEGFDIAEVDLDVDLAEVVEDHRTVMLHEAGLAHGYLLEGQAELLQPRIRQALSIGVTLTESAATAARTRLDEARERVWSRLAMFDAALLQPVPRPAPHGFATTGDQSYQTPWTAFHGPLITVPGELNCEGLPLATMLAAAPDADAALIAIAAAVQAIIDRLPDVAPLSLPLDPSSTTG